MNSAVRVLARYKQALDEQALKSIRDKLTNLDRVLAQSEQLERDLAPNPNAAKMESIDSLNPIRAMARMDSIFKAMKMFGMATVFLDILKGFQLDKADRKIIETAAKQFAKTRQNKVPKEKALEAFPIYLKNLRTISETCKRIVEQNKHHLDEATGEGAADTVMKAGPFTLINTGGFPEKTMEEVAKVCIEAARRLTGLGLGKLCYGNIQVTNTVGRSTRVLAFYMVKNDDMYVRANLKGKAGPALESVMHELGHRLQFRFVSPDKQKEINAIYHALSGKDERAQWEAEHNPELHPKPGDAIEDRNGPIVCLEMTRERGKQLVMVQQKEKKFLVPLSAWVKYTKHSNFVSQYAKTDAGENFAEMIAHWGMGTLPKDQEEMLGAVL